MPKEAVSRAVTGITDTVIVGHQSVRMRHTIHQQMTELGVRCHRRKYRHCGYSPLELVSAMGLIAVMMTLVVPAFSTTLAQGRVITASHDMMADLQTARFTAISRQQIVVVCPSTDGNACTNNSRWEDWMDIVRRPGRGSPKIKRRTSDSCLWCASK